VQGGDRVYECDGNTENMDPDGNCQDELKVMLNNNAQGRFRLETSIWVVGDDNSSPRPTMIPVIPLPRGTQSKPITRFQVRAHEGLHCVAYRSKRWTSQPQSRDPKQ
jgi:hypothetical protein